VQVVASCSQWLWEGHQRFPVHDSEIRVVSSPNFYDSLSFHPAAAFSYANMQKSSHHTPESNTRRLFGTNGVHHNQRGYLALFASVTGYHIVAPLSDEPQPAVEAK